MNFADAPSNTQNISFSAAYYSCAQNGETQWIIATNQGQKAPLQIYGVSLSNISIGINGTKVNSSDSWQGLIHGQFVIGGGSVSLEAAGSVRFGSVQGVEALQVHADFSSPYILLDFDINYQDNIQCESVTYQYGVFDTNDVTTYNGGVGSGTVVINSI
jgi:hypothetical protein